MKQVPHVKFKPMSPDDYEQWHSLLGENYAADLVKAGFVTEAKATERAETQLKKMLKEGLDTENHYFYIVHDADSDDRVGLLWIMYEEMEEKKHCFIADLEIDEHYRRQGYGRATMLHCETIAKAENAHAIRLHVFGFNSAAISLYDNIGYAAISQQMEKVLD